MAQAFPSSKLSHMKSLLLLTALLLALSPAPFVAAQENAAAKKDHTPLEERMEKINSAWRRLRRQVEDPAQNASSLELVARIREAAKGTEKMKPAKLEEVPEAERAKFLAEYRASLKKFAGQLDALEAALKGNRNAEAQQVIVAIGDHQKASHKAFRKPPPPKK